MIFIGRTDGESETPVIWSSDGKNWLLGKDSVPRNDWRHEEKGITEDEMIGWYHRLRWTWILASSRSWWWAGKPGMLQSMGSKIVRTTEWLNWTDSMINMYHSFFKHSPIERYLGWYQFLLLSFATNIKMLWTFMYIFLSQPKLLFPWDNYLRV